MSQGRLRDDVGRSTRGAAVSGRRGVPQASLSVLVCLEAFKALELLSYPLVASYDRTSVVPHVRIHQTILLTVVEQHPEPFFRLNR